MKTFAVVVTPEELNTLREACLALNLHWIEKVAQVEAISAGADGSSKASCDAHAAEYKQRAERAQALYSRLVAVKT